MMANTPIDETVMSEDSDEIPNVDYGRASVGGTINLPVTSGKVYGGGQLIDPEKIKEQLAKPQSKKGVKSWFKKLI